VPLTMLRPDDPRTVGPFQLQGRLGSGGMGDVFLAFDAAGRAIALKTLPPGAGEEARTRLRREADLLVGVRSPHVARCLGADTASSVPWIAMDYVQGPTLHEAATPLPDPALRLLAAGLAEALAALHAQGIVHRDVKPANVILTHQGPMLVDLGIARTQDLTALTRAGFVVGSPGWMAPEQLGGGQVSSAVDVWGWGSALLFGATGRLPFGDGPLEVLMHRLRTEEPEISGVPAWLEPPLRRALVKQPAARATAAEILAALGGQAPTVLLGTVPRPTVAAHVPPPVVLPVSRPAARIGSTPWLAPVAVLAAVVVAAATWLFLHRPAADAGSTQAASSTPAATSTTDPSTTQPSTTPSTSSTASAPSSSTSTEATTSGTDGDTSDGGTSDGDTSGEGAAWGDADVVVRAVRSQDQERPAFPDEVPGYSLADETSQTVRLVDGDKRWQALYPFPAAMSGCDHRRFYVRWRALDPSAEVEATWVSADRRAIESKAARGSAGWQSNYACSQPAFRLRSGGGDRSTLTDVIVDVQRWDASN
jgi:serine/threonine protein kinase